ncbi:MAG: phosphoethanolamine transferase [Rhodobacter sp.]|nr:phosphoethanolamine transferase [Paracoccaceae bacterium]MCC0077580.1 phosphoethanolamine transferase [Rhodobacter sp.]
MTEPAKKRLSLPPRPCVGHLTLNLIVTAYVMAVLNPGFWVRLTAIFDDSPVNIALFAVSLAALTLFTLELLGPGVLQKPVAAVLILMAASATYYERTFGVLVDRELIRSVLETTPTEASHLITPGAVLWIALTGVLPAALVFWPRVRRVRAVHHLWRWPLAVMVSLAVFLGGMFADFKAASAVLREHQELTGSFQPGATLMSILRYTRQQLRVTDRVVQTVGGDAVPGQRLQAAAEPVLMVLFVGETLRAPNFGLDGYARNTTPELAARDIVNLTAVHSCGTATTISVPCMFSPFAQADYSREEFLTHENLLDILARAGFDVQWYDNNTGDQGVAARTGWQTVDPALDPVACEVECTDEVFLPLIEQTAATITRNTVLVLHMIGNHGPAYYLRYPEARRAFTPDCQTSHFADCTTDEIVNAYDNAVLETDYVLSQAIDILNASDRVLPAMVFVSDHGESLGEDGLYLHAAPMFMAPETQTRVPMVMWAGAGFRSAMSLDEACLTDVAEQPASHDNLFHTVLGMLDVTTGVRDASLDLTSGCHVTRQS